MLQDKSFVLVLVFKIAFSVVHVVINYKMVDPGFHKQAVTTTVMSVVKSASQWNPQVSEIRKSVKSEFYVLTYKIA